MEAAKTDAPEVSPVAIRILAKCYAKGYGCKGTGMEMNEKTAFTLYKKSTEMGDVFAKQSLARCYQLGIGTEKNLDSVLSLLMSSQRNQTPKSLCRFAMIALYGNALRPRDIYKLFETASKNSSLSAESYRGFCYLHGVGVEKNRKMAIEILEKTVEQDSFYGIYPLANGYLMPVIEDKNGLSGDPTEQKYQKDYNKIATLIQRLINKRNSVDKRDDQRIEMMAECLEAFEGLYKKGLGVPQDDVKAITLHNLREELLHSSRRLA